MKKEFLSCLFAVMPLMTQDQLTPSETKLIA